MALYLLFSLTYFYSNSVYAYYKSEYAGCFSCTESCTKNCFVLHYYTEMELSKL